MSSIKIFEQVAESENITITALERIIGASKGVLSRAIKHNTGINQKWFDALVEKFPQYKGKIYSYSEENVDNEQLREPSIAYIKKQEDELNELKSKMEELLLKINRASDMNEAKLLASDMYNTFEKLAAMYNVQTDKYIKGYEAFQDVRDSWNKKKWW